MAKRKDKPQDKNVLLNKDEAAAYLGIKPRTLQYYRDKKEGPKAVEFGRKLIRYQKEDLDAWLKQLKH